MKKTRKKAPGHGTRASLPSRRRDSLNKHSAAIRSEIQRRLRHLPFQPFFLVLEDGCCGLVWNPEFIAIHPGGEFELFSRGTFATAKYSDVTHIAALSVIEALRYAETLLPGTPPRKGSDPDPRWQAIILVGEFIETEPRAVWEFIRKWGCHRQRDLRAAIHCCLLEHLLEHHFAEFFPEVEQLAFKSATFAEIAVPLRYFRNGQAEEPSNSERLDRLSQRLERQEEQRKRRRRRR